MQALFWINGKYFFVIVDDNGNSTFSEISRNSFYKLYTRKTNKRRYKRRK